MGCGLVVNEERWGWTELTSASCVSFFRQSGYLAYGCFGWLRNRS